MSREPTRRPQMADFMLPSLRVDAELHAAAEGVLRDGETVTALTETAVREAIERR